MSWISIRDEMGAFKPFLLGFETGYRVEAQLLSAEGSNRSFWDLKQGNVRVKILINLKFKPFLLGFETRPDAPGRPHRGGFKPFLLGFETSNEFLRALEGKLVQTVPSGI